MTALLPGLHAALLLARGRADALALLPPFGDRSAADPMAAARQSFWYDLKILMLTVPVAFKNRAGN